MTDAEIMELVRTALNTHFQQDGFDASATTQDGDDVLIAIQGCSPRVLRIREVAVTT